MPIDTMQCLSRLTLDAAALRWMMALPAPAHEAVPEVHCELAAGHDGPHCALGQRSADRDWWFRWTLQAYETVVLPGCAAVGPPDPAGERAPCVLFDGHPAAHTYDLPRSDPPG